MNLWGCLIILDQFKTILRCTFYGPNTGFHDHVWVKLIFESNMCFWIKLDGIWRLVLLLVWKWVLCEFCLNEWIIKIPISDPNSFVWIKCVSKWVYGSILDNVWRKILKNVWDLSWWFLYILAKIRCSREKQMSMNFKGARSSFKERKDNKHEFWELTYKF